MRAYTQARNHRIVPGFKKHNGGEVEPTFTVQQKILPWGWVTLWVSATYEAATSSLQSETGETIRQ